MLGKPVVSGLHVNGLLSVSANSGAFCAIYMYCQAPAAQIPPNNFSYCIE